MREFSRIINPPAACACNHVSNDMWMLIQKTQNNGAWASWVAVTRHSCSQVFAFCYPFLATLQLMDNLMELILHGPTCTQNPTALCTPCNVLSFRALTPPGLGVTCISCNQLTCQFHCHQGDLEDLPAVGLKGTAAHSEPEIAPVVPSVNVSRSPTTMKHETTTMFDGFSSITEHVDRTSDFWWVKPHVLYLQLTSA